MAESTTPVPPSTLPEHAQQQEALAAAAPTQDSVATDVTATTHSADVAAAAGSQSEAAVTAPSLDASQSDHLAAAAAVAGAPEAVTAPLAESAAVSAPVPAPETARSTSVVSTPVFDTGPRHPNDAAPGRITKGGSLLTGGYLAHKIYVGNLPERQGSLPLFVLLLSGGHVLTCSHLHDPLSTLTVLHLRILKTALARSGRAPARSSADLASW